MSNHGTHVRRAAQKPGCKPARKAIPLFVLAALFVVALAGVGGTYAYLTYTTNQASNPLSIGEVQVSVVENGAELSSDESKNNVSLGSDSKQVALKNTGTVPAYLRVTFVPEVRSVSQGVETDANVFMDQTWPATFTGTELSLGLVTLHFAEGWTSNWTYKDGTFYSKQPVAAGTVTTTLLMGVTTTSDYDTSKHGTVYVNVIADAIQESAAAEEWGISS